MIEIADIFKKHGSSYLSKYSAGMLPSHIKAFDDILKCRTPIMGGKVYYCPDCKRYQYSYHSCGNRNCPKCQNDKADLWLEKNNNLLLPVNHFMITFTLPKELRSFARSNQKLFYNLLFKCSSKSIEKLSADPKYIGGKPGMIGILHTWSRTLVYHPHVHYIVTGGGISEDKSKWNKSRSNFLLPVKALSVIFRAKFRDALRKANPIIYDAIPSSVWSISWVVNSIPVGRGKKALKYLAQYVFRIAIPIGTGSNNRIISLKNGVVIFKYKNSKTKLWEIMELEVEEFIRRFLQHVLPSGFVKVRYYGLFAVKNRTLLAEIRDVLGCGYNGKKLLPKTNKPKVFKCPVCKKEMVVVIVIPRPSRRFNKAPPKMNSSFDNQIFNRCA
ncbi:MAG TPA: transposase [Ignavibacteria bacterium]|nr:transposase [Ignavibacteria bacterium]